VHSGHRASHRLISDVGRPDYFGQPFFEISVPRAGTRVGGDPRYARTDDASVADELLLNARFTVAELLRNGITTFVEFGSQLKVQEALDAQVNELGIRAYLGPGFDSGRWVGGPGGRLTRVVDEAAGERELALALDFIERRATTTGCAEYWCRARSRPARRRCCGQRRARRTPESCLSRSMPPTTSMSSSTSSASTGRPQSSCSKRSG
jgi:5-methylthioadenosine/S-adenosylhomocysteine deaminase